MSSLNEVDIKKIIKEHLGVDTDAITPATTFEKDLGADSLDMVELVMAFEEHYGFEDVQDEQIEKITTYGELLEFLTAQMIKEHA